jgi:hypothetical protein
MKAPIEIANPNANAPMSSFRFIASRPVPRFVLAVLFETRGEMGSMVDRREMGLRLVDDGECADQIEPRAPGQAEGIVGTDRGEVNANTGMTTVSEWRILFICKHLRRQNPLYIAIYTPSVPIMFHVKH